MEKQENSETGYQKTQPQEQKAPDTSTLIQKAESVAEMMNRENNRYEELVKRAEDVAARMMLSGKASAGEVKKTPEQEKEDALDKAVKEAYNRYK
jgi:hypothetical protein